MPKNKNYRYHEYVNFGVDSGSNDHLDLSYDQRIWKNLTYVIPDHNFSESTTTNYSATAYGSSGHYTLSKKKNSTHQKNKDKKYSAIKLHTSEDQKFVITEDKFLTHTYVPERYQIYYTDETTENTGRFWASRKEILGLDALCY